MVVTKQIDWDGYNIAEIISINDADEPLCNLKKVGENGAVIKQDGNISFPADNMPFELTEDDLNILYGDEPEDEGSENV